MEIYNGMIIYNKDDLKELKGKILETYPVSDTTTKLEKDIYSLLDQGDYEQIHRVFEEYAQSIINMEDLKTFSINYNDSFGAGMTFWPAKENNFNREKVNLLKMKYYCTHMLSLIYEYEREQNQYKKRLLEIEIQSTIEKNRYLEEVKTDKSR